MAMLVLTSCRMKDTGQTNTEDAGTAREQAASSSEHRQDMEPAQGFPRGSGNGGNSAQEDAGGAGPAGKAGPEDEAGTEKREPLSGRYRTWKPETSL